jgi:hypothetical protein
MIQEKNPSNKTEELAIEKQLLPRLKFMGILLILFSGCTLFYSLFFTADIDEELARELASDQFIAPQEMEYSAGFDLFEEKCFHAYIVTASFAVVGLACLLIVWKKGKKSRNMMN